MSAQFSSWWDFIRFSESVRQHNRFIHDQQVMDFLNTLLQTSNSRHRTLQDGSYVWRAQLGSDSCMKTEKHENIEIIYEDDTPFAADRMKPRQYAAHEGRANPRGIPCLYVATDSETAMAEVRPWLGANVSIGQFRLKKQVTLIDFSVGHDAAGKYFFEEPDPLIRESTIWNQVDKAFSEPVSNDMAEADYVPTQIISEFFKKQGFDGVVYKSKLGQGHNLALFDLQVADMSDCAIRLTKAINFEFSPPTQGYSVKTTE